MEEANTSRSAMAARRCRKLTATSTGSPCVGSTISNSLCAEAKKEKKKFLLENQLQKGNRTTLVDYVRRGGRRQQRQQPSAGDDEVIRQLRYQMHRVDDEDGALAAVDELQH